MSLKNEYKEISKLQRVEDELYLRIFFLFLSTHCLTYLWYDRTIRAKTFEVGKLLYRSLIIL